MTLPAQEEPSSIIDTPDPYRHCDHEDYCHSHQMRLLNRIPEGWACPYPCEHDTRSHHIPPAEAPECINCPKPAIGYGIGKDEVRLIQCNTCMFDGKRECMYHGYPDETIPVSCAYKIGAFAVIGPIEAQMHNKQHDAAIRKDEREKVLGEGRDCATCCNKHNAEKYVNRMKACSQRVFAKRKMDECKQYCHNRSSMLIQGKSINTLTWEFEFAPAKCRGYNGDCEQQTCRHFQWWHAKCSCPIIREYDKQKESLREREKK